ncbi:glutamate dehydrogenase [Citrobacter koseri]|uniref:Glutamate dehydrogenase n=1 Tax=Citrobacter koseri TaxID=545 RepID=A0A3S4IZI3_CITKO|nr:glutamate dehydrogenase [Citrobacter koseri]
MRAASPKKKLARLCEIKASRDGRVADYAREFGLPYMEGKQPWSVPVDIALPCATQNELDVDAARVLIANGVKAVAEGANMPTTIEATDLFLEAGVLFAPGKAANAGGVATSGLEMAQKRRANELESRESGCASAPHHAGYSSCLRGIRRRKQTYQLCSRGEHRRLRQSGRRDAGAGRDLIFRGMQA